jgi:HSP20 family protein
MKSLIPWRRKGEGLLPIRRRSDPVQALQGRMNDLFDDFFGGFEDVFGGAPMQLAKQGEGWLAESPSFEVSESEDEFRVKAELPGMDEKDVDVSLEGDELTIRGEKKREREEKRRDYHVTEVSYGEFYRSFRLPEGVDREKAKAQFKKGVLTLTLPKTEQVKAARKRIAIDAE